MRKAAALPLAPIGAGSFKTMDMGKSGAPHALTIDIAFQLDFTHYSKNTGGLEPVHYQLDCMTRAITSSEGRGVLHRILGEGHVLRYFQKNGGIQGMAELAAAENISRYMRYDGTGETWRTTLCCSCCLAPPCGRWRNF